MNRHRVLNIINKVYNSLASVRSIAVSLGRVRSSGGAGVGVGEGRSGGRRGDKYEEKKSRTTSVQTYLVKGKKFRWIV